MRGKLIAIEGSDASGKTTQTKLLISYLRQKGKSVLPLKFPYYDSYYGNIIKKYLSGELGSIDTVSPYLIAPIYALERAVHKEAIAGELDKGGYVVSDRYTPSNIIHHAVRLKDKEAVETFSKWIEDVERNALGIPPENVVIYLHVPFEISEGLLRERNNAQVIPQKDIHEESRTYRKKVYERYELLAKKHSHWKRIECADLSGKLLSPEEIHKKVVAALKL